MVLSSSNGDERGERHAFVLGRKFYQKLGQSGALPCLIDKRRKTSSGQWTWGRESLKSWGWGDYPHHRFHCEGRVKRSHGRQKSPDQGKKTKQERKVENEKEGKIGRKKFFLVLSFSCFGGKIRVTKTSTADSCPIRGVYGNKGAWAPSIVWS